MIRCVGFSSEHKEVPNRLLFGSKSTDENKHILSDEQSSNVCTYAWFETDEIDTSTLPDYYNNRIPIAVMDYKPCFNCNVFVFEEPIWSYIEDTRTPEIQRWIEQNLERINELFITFAQANGYLKNV